MIPPPSAGRPPAGLPPVVHRPVVRRSAGRRLALLVAMAVGTLVVGGGCVPTGERPEFADQADPVPGDPAGGPGEGTAGVVCPPPGDRFAAFATGPIAVIGTGGRSVQCVLVADTVELRQRGLSGVPDTGGHAGMIFAFAEDTTGSFWMGNTHVPLTIAFIDSTGVPVSILDMEPCPEAVDCPSYFPDQPYRWALEVPLGTLDRFGLTDGATLDPATLPPARG